ncbi:hypothetical protein B0O99DRAFT_588520 [Bisporella sp. PMI_857]|nr:hypothetical protein B0O99DRAFT_588520 [Bisporella sp. PMI_857]
MSPTNHNLRKAPHVATADRKLNMAFNPHMFPSEPHTSAIHRHKSNFDMHNNTSKPSKSHPQTNKEASQCSHCLIIGTKTFYCSQSYPSIIVLPPADSPTTIHASQQNIVFTNIITPCRFDREASPSRKPRLYRYSKPSVEDDVEKQEKKARRVRRKDEEYEPLIVEVDENEILLAKGTEKLNLKSEDKGDKRVG